MSDFLISHHPYLLCPGHGAPTYYALVMAHKIPSKVNLQHATEKESQRDQSHRHMEDGQTELVHSYP